MFIFIGIDNFSLELKECLTMNQKINEKCLKLKYAALNLDDLPSDFGLRKKNQAYHPSNCFLPNYHQNGNSE